MEDYEEFDGLVHATHIEALRRIAIDGQISGRVSTDSTVANGGLNLIENTTVPPEYACVHHTKTCWVAPNSELNSRFGPVVFNLSLDGTEGILRRGSHGNGQNHFTYYFLEMIDYHKSQSASRIFVVPTRLVAEYQDLDHLRFDPSHQGAHLGVSAIRRFKFPRDIKSWSVVRYYDCKRLRDKCTELRISKTEAFLCTWALMKRFSTRSTRMLAYKELNDDYNDDESHGVVLVRTLDGQPRFLEAEPASMDSNWEIFLSCLRDHNFPGAYAAARKIPNATLNLKLPSHCRFDT
ncbi:hypothetical protein HKX48_004370 [Thoreauomyces humboldtii]|nr:hypothetical protein HKX48_004353 [Thoreauomyces humboldtii]KAJ3023076.1 hypothetical protein HKX48_004370 [Thoreauomyces humboldtii]